MMQRQSQAALGWVARTAQAALLQQHQQQGLLLPAFSSAAAATKAEGAAATAASSSIHVACVLERLPVLAGPPPAWESEYHSWLTQQEIKHGLRSDYPHVKHIYAPMSDSSKQQPQQAAGGGGGEQGTQGAAQGQQQEQPPGVEPDQVPITASDKSGDNRSMRRALASRLYLLVKQKQGGTWQFPQAAVKEGESVRETCERALVSSIGQRYPFFFIGNAPMAHVELPQNGGRLFFMLAQVVDDPWGRVRLAADGGAVDYMWATRDEVEQQLTERSVAQIVPQMLLP